MSELRWS